MNTTYNPILQARNLRRIRLSVKDLRPTINTALVLVSHVGESLVIRSGQAIPQVRTANYRELFVIDTSEHLLQLDCRLPTLDSAFEFVTSITYRCRVIAPDLVVAKSYTDVGPVIASLLTRTLRATSRAFDVADAGRAEAQVNRDLRVDASGLGFEVSDCLVELSLDRDEAGHRRKLRNTLNTVKVEQAELEHVMPYVEAGDVGMLALFVAKHREHAGAVVELLMERDHERGEQLIDAMKVVFDKRTGDDDFEIESVRTKIARQVVDEMSGERSSTSLSLSRGGRLRGTLLPGASDARSTDPAPAQADGHDRDDDRLRATDRPRAADFGDRFTVPADPDADA